MPRVGKKEPAKHDKDKIVFCRFCKNASQFIGNGCYCKEKDMRVCVCSNHGRKCADFITK